MRATKLNGLLECFNSLSTSFREKKSWTLTTFSELFLKSKKEQTNGYEVQIISALEETYGMTENKKERIPLNTPVKEGPCEEVTLKPIL